MRRTYSGVAAALLVTAIAAGPAAAVQSKCLAGKTKCVSKEAFSLIKCEWKARTPGRPNDPNAGGCVDKATAVFDGGALPDKGCLEKLENVATNDCVSFDDTQALQTLVDQCVASVVSTIDPMLPNQTKCNVGKHKCAAKKLKGLLKCQFKATTPGKPEDPNADGCVDKVLARFDGGADRGEGLRREARDEPADRLHGAHRQPGGHRGGRRRLRRLHHATARPRTSTHLRLTTTTTCGAAQRRGRAPAGSARRHVAHQLHDDDEHAGRRRVLLRHRAHRDGGPRLQRADPRRRLRHSRAPHVCVAARHPGDRDLCDGACACDEPRRDGLLLAGITTEI
jgi:hypothetical protein